MVDDPEEVPSRAPNVLDDKGLIEEVESDEEDSSGIFINFSKF